MPFTLQVVVPDELIDELDDYVRRLNALYPGGGPTRSALVRHMLNLAVPMMRASIERTEMEARQSSAAAFAAERKRQVALEARQFADERKRRVIKPTPKKPTRRR